MRVGAITYQKKTNSPVMSIVGFMTVYSLLLLADQAVAE